MNKYFNRGISFIEIMVVISILGIIITIVTPSLSSFRNQQTLNNTTDDIVSVLNLARNQTLSSQNSNYYSVHFTSGSATLFTGGTYSSGNSTNYVVSFSDLVNTETILSDRGSDVSFTRLTGEATNYGNIVVQLVSNSANQKTITINKIGTISVN